MYIHHKPKLLCVWTLDCVTYTMITSWKWSYSKAWSKETNTWNITSVYRQIWKQRQEEEEEEVISDVKGQSVCSERSMKASLFWCTADK